MAESADELLLQYGRVTDLAIEYFKKPAWTPAFAISFVCGIKPVMGCRAIPKRGMQVRRASMRATPRQLRRATELLQDWRDDHADEDDPSVRPPAKVVPLEFFDWCRDACQNTIFKPDLLDHLLGLIYAPNDDDPLPPVSMEFLERAKALEHYKRMELEVSLSTAKLVKSAVAGGSGNAVVVRRSGRYGRVCPLAAEILEARGLTPVYQRMDAGAVLAVMLRFARDGAHPKIEKSTPERLLYVKNGRLAEYTQRALQQYLDARPVGPDGEPLAAAAR